MRYLLLLLCAFSFFSSNATHLAGGEISYTHVTGLTYHVKVKLYRDCSGSPAPIQIILNSNSINLAINQTDTMLFSSSMDYSSFCYNINTTCNGGIYPGHQFWVYEGNITLPGAASDWKFSTSICCRNGTIDNIVNPGAQNLGLVSTLNNSLLTNWNNSAQFMLENGLIFNTGQTYILNQTAIDIDGDSIDYQLVNPVNTIINGNITNCMFVGGLSPTNPFPGSISINNQNGNMTFNCSVQGEFVLAIKVSEYRNGVLVGSIIRDLQLLFTLTNANNLPTLSGVNGTANYYTIVHACVGNPLTFTVNSTDADVTDSVYVTMNTNNIPGSTLTMNNAAQPVATFSWSPTAADVRPQPYLLGLQARDNHCDLNGIQNYGYLIYVTQCNTDTVWPGDANADFTVNNYDVLNIGLINNLNGIVRPAATTNWTPEYCPNWIDTFINGINNKHADCNGDGIVNNADLLVVTANYGQFHLKKDNIGEYKTRGLPDLFFDTNGLEAIPGFTLQIPVHLGTLSSPMNNIYGIAGKVIVSNTLSNNISLNNPLTWFVATGNGYLFQKNTGGYNATEFTLVKGDHNNSSGYGQIATLSVPIDANAIAGSDLILQFANLKLIDNEGNEISAYNALSDTLKIVWPLNSSEISDMSSKVSVYPNPILNTLTVEINKMQNINYEVRICDVTGKVIYTNSLHGTKNIINTSAFSKGIYFVKVSNSANENYTYKITK